MKLLRYGGPGKERPAMLDATGAIRDLSGVITDIAGTALLPESLEKLRQLDPAVCLSSQIRRGWVRASAPSANLSALGSTIPIMLLSRAWLFRLSQSSL